MDISLKKIIELSNSDYILNRARDSCKSYIEECLEDIKLQEDKPLSVDEIIVVLDKKSLSFYNRKLDYLYLEIKLGLYIYLEDSIYIDNLKHIGEYILIL